MEITNSKLKKHIKRCNKALELSEKDIEKYQSNGNDEMADLLKQFKSFVEVEKQFAEDLVDLQED